MSHIDAWGMEVSRDIKLFELMLILQIIFNIILKFFKFRFAKIELEYQKLLTLYTESITYNLEKMKIYLLIISQLKLKLCIYLKYTVFPYI